MYCTYVVRLRLILRFKNYYRRGLVYFDVPIEEKDNVIVPPLEGFVMNRVLGDYLETFQEFVTSIVSSISNSINIGK